MGTTSASEPGGIENELIGFVSYESYWAYIYMCVWFEQANAGGWLQMHPYLHACADQCAMCHHRETKWQTLQCNSVHSERQLQSKEGHTTKRTGDGGENVGHGSRGNTGGEHKNEGCSGRAAERRQQAGSN